MAAHAAILRTAVLVLAAGALLLARPARVASVITITLVAVVLLVVVEVLVGRAGVDGRSATCR